MKNTITYQNIALDKCMVIPKFVQVLKFYVEIKLGKMFVVLINFH